MKIPKFKMPNFKHPNIRFALTLRCNIERPTDVRTATGGLIKAWSTIFTDVECGVKELSGDELLQYGIKMTTEGMRFYFVDDMNLNTQDRIRYDSKYWNIIGINSVAGFDKFWHIDTELLLPITAGST